MKNAPNHILLDSNFNYKKIPQGVKTLAENLIKRVLYSSKNSSS